MIRPVKAVIALVLCLTLCLPVCAMGVGDEDIEYLERCTYEHHSDTFKSTPVTDDHGIAVTADTEYVTDFDSFVTELRDRMVERQARIVINYSRDTKVEETFFDVLADKLFEHTGNPVEGDYLYYHYKTYSCSYSGHSKGGVYYYTFTFDVQYHSNAEQEAVVDREIQKIIQNIESKYDNLYEKIVAAYRFVTNNTEYDYENLDNDNYTLKYSAYAALINKTSVCQGYSNLLYRLSLELGIDCRIISGTANGGPHAWNIIKGHDGDYYLFDATWDASNIRNGLGHSYCFNGSDEFEDHFTNDKFLTEEFTSKYPISNDHHHFAVADHVFDNVWHIDNYATSTESGEKSHHCTVCGHRGEVIAVPYVNAENLYRNYELKSWSCDGINFVSSNSLMGDTGNGDFQQTGKMTRSMFVTVLYRLAGSPEVSTTSPFTDLDPAQSWYHNAVTWAFENGIVTGTSAVTFSPNAEVTREQIATFLYRYTVNYLKTDVSDIENDISSFPDESSVASYARDALTWANGVGLIKGQSSGGTSILAPKNDATREEVAVVIFRFCIAG